MEDDSRPCGGKGIFKEGIRGTDLTRQSPVEIFGSILPQKSFKIEVLGNGISDILRPSQATRKFKMQSFLYWHWQYPNPRLDSPQRLELLRQGSYEND